MSNEQNESKENTMDKIVELKEENISMVGALNDLLSQARELGANVESLSTAAYRLEKWMREDPSIPV